MCWIDYRTQSSTIKSVDCVRFALVNLYKVSPKQSHQSKFFLCLVTFYSITETPFTNCSRQLREQNKTSKQPVHVTIEGDLIVRARLHIGMHSLSPLFSLKPWKLRHPWRQSDIPGNLLLRIWSWQSTAHLKPFLRNFFVYEKHVRYTPGSGLRAQVTRASKIWLWIFNACFTQITSFKIERLFGLDWPFFIGEFDFVRLSNSIELNLWIELDWVRFGLD